MVAFVGSVTTSPQSEFGEVVVVSDVLVVLMQQFMTCSFLVNTPTSSQKVEASVTWKWAWFHCGESIETSQSEVEEGGSHKKKQQDPQEQNREGEQLHRKSSGSYEGNVTEEEGEHVGSTQR